MHSHLRGLLAQERDVDLGEVRRHHHLAPHVLWGLVQDGFPEGLKQLLPVIDAGIHYGPYVAAQDLGRDVWVSPRIA